MASNIMDEDVVVVGGGIAGLATALGLHRVGMRVLVLEKSDEPRITGACLSLAGNAWRALEALGVAHKLASLYPPFTKAKITDIRTGEVEEIDFTGEHGPLKEGGRAVHRRVLQEKLAEELPAGSVRYSSKIASIETETTKDDSTIAILHLHDGVIIKAKVLIGCDGVHSIVAKWLALKDPVESGRWAIQGLSTFPSGHGLTYSTELFIEPGKRGGLVPVNDTEVYWFLSSKYSTSNKHEIFKTKPDEILHATLNDTTNYPGIFKDIIKHSDMSSLSWTPLLFRYPHHLISNRLVKHCVTVAGDAMHPMTPDMGQGGCSALEDAVVLSRHIGLSFIKNGRRIDSLDVNRAMEEYAKERRWRAAWLIMGSHLANWAHGGGSGWFVKFIRRVVFYVLVIKWVANYDCGKLPSATEAFLSGGGKYKSS